MAAPTEGTLAHMREKLIELTGRSDLRAEDAVGKKRADFFLNAGQRLLDRLIKHPNTECWYIPTSLTTAGDNLFKVKYCRAIKEVWVVENSTDADGVRHILKPTTARWLKANYAYGTSTDDYSVPEYWAPTTIGLAPEQYSLATTAHDDVPDTTHIQYVESASANPFVYKAIMVAPACEANLSIHILGDFLSRPLSAETDATFWTLNYPEALVLAAATELEGFLRNSQGYADYRAQLLDIVYGIDMDMAEQDVATDEDLQMDSSWTWNP